MSVNKGTNNSTNKGISKSVSKRKIASIVMALGAMVILQNNQLPKHSTTTPTERELFSLTIISVLQVKLHTIENGVFLQLAVGKSSE